MNSKKLYGVVFLALTLSIFMFCVLLSCAPRPSGLTKIATFEGGTAYRTTDNVYWVLNLKGTWTLNDGKLKLTEMTGCGLILSESEDAFYNTDKYHYFFTPLYRREASICSVYGQDNRKRY